MSNSAVPPKRREGKMLFKNTINSVLLLSVLFVGSSCSATAPASPRLPYGGVSRLMDMPEFQEVKSSTPAVRRWAKSALEEVNDLELSYQIKK